MASVVYLLFMLIIHFQFAKSTEDDCSIKTFFVKIFSSDFVRSFNKFTNNLRKFFRLPIDKVEDKSVKVKNAFYRFIGLDATGRSCDLTKHIELSENSLEGSEYLRSSSALQLIDLDGFKGQSHTVITTDGYKLALHRVLPGNQTIAKNKIAFLHHGLLGSSCDWLLLGRTKALPYLLADAGYDVWLANARGNKYSRDHIFKSVDTREFWDFSWYEIGIFDLPAAINYIRLHTEGNSMIDFIGHSMGATALLVLLSTTPQYNFVLRSATLLGPLAFMYETKGPLRLLAEFQSEYGFESLRFLGVDEFMSTESYPGPVIDQYCRGDDRLCLNPWLLTANGGKHIPDLNLKANVLSHIPAGASTKTIIHYAQLVRSGQFQMFDFGSDKNYKLYGTRSPPKFNLDDVTVPVLVISSNDDWLSTTSDILTLVSKLPNILAHHLIRRKDFSHTDFMWSEYAPIDLYYKIIDELDRIANVKRE